jgi:RHS repeat-associated protein
MMDVIWTATEYDPNDNVVTVVGPHLAQTYTGTGSRTTVTYDTMDRPTRVTGPDKTVDSNGERTDYVYDKAGRLTRVTLPRGVQTATPLDDFATEYAYDKLDRPVSETHIQGAGSGPTRRTFYCYDDPRGDLEWVVSPRSQQTASPCTGPKPSHTTEYVHDPAHRVTDIRDPLYQQGPPEKHRVHFEYDANGNVLQITNADGAIEQRQYDQRNLLTRVTEPFITGHDVVTAFKYDNNGNLAELISPRAWDASPDPGPDKQNFPEYTTKYFYDGLNRLERVELPKRTAEPQHYIHHKYDPNGNLLETSLPTTHLNYNSIPTQEKTVLTYFDTGWIRTANDPGVGPIVTFDYTPEGWQKERLPKTLQGADDTLRKMTTSYFLDGMVREVKDREGLIHTYAYDANNNLTSANRLAKNDNHTMQIIAKYDGFDQLKEVQQKRKAHQWRGTTYTYDPNGNIATREDDQPRLQDGSLGSGRLNTYTYDFADFLRQQLDNHGTPGTAADDRLIETDFFPTGWEQKRVVKRGSQVKQTTNWTYFPNGKLQVLEIRNGSDNLIERHTVEYLSDTNIYVNGHRTKDTFKIVGPNTQCNASFCESKFTYDGRDRLTTYSDGQSPTPTVTTYTLDTIGNVTGESRPGTERTFIYNVDRLVEEKLGGQTVKKYFYDPYGNLKCVTNSSGQDPNCNVSNQATQAPNVLALYTHDGLNRLIQFRGFTGGNKTDETFYDYDPLDRVVEEKETHPSTGLRTTNFSHLGLSSLVTAEDRVQTGHADKAYGYDAYGNRITMTNTTSSETKEFTYAYDTHGSVSALVNQAGGAVHATYGYGPYGAPDEDLTKVDTDKHSPLNPYRYSAKRLDSGSDSYDMGARRFAADPGRFLEQDLFMGALSDLGLTLDPLTQNRYGLAGGNPISFIEWDGHYATFNGHGNATRDYPVGGAARAAARMWDRHAREGRSGWGWGAGGGDEDSDEGSVWTRVWGGVKLIGGVLEAFAGCTFAVGTAATGVGAAAGGAVCLHGADTAASGFRQLVSGESDKTFTQQGLEAVGVPEDVAGGVDAGISFVGTWGTAGAARASASLPARGIGTASRAGTPADIVAIGKVDDLATGLRPGERALQLTNLGSPRLNWQQNAGALRAEMARGVPIRDVSVDPLTGQLVRNTGFLRAERNLLQDRGWAFNPKTGYWFPPG